MDRGKATKKGRSEIISSIPVLNMMLEDMREAPPLFQPTQFWRACSQEIIRDLEEKGVESFKLHESALCYYVTL